MRLPRGHHKGVVRADCIEKPAAILRDVLRIIALEISETERIRWQRTYAAYPRAEGIDEPRLFEWFTHQSKYVGSAVTASHLVLSHDEPGLNWWLLFVFLHS